MLKIIEKYIKESHLICLNIIISALIVYFLMNINPIDRDLRHIEFEKFREAHLGGIIVNETNFPIKIKDNYKIVEIPPGKSSREVGVKDADLLIIERPVIFENKKYSAGVIRFCDTVKVKVYSKNGEIFVKPSLNYAFYKRYKDLGWFPPYFYLRFNQKI